MNSQKYLTQIKAVIEKLNEMQRAMSAQVSAIPYAEVDDFLVQLKKLYEISLQLQYQNALMHVQELESAIATRQEKDSSGSQTAPTSAPEGTRAVHEANQAYSTAQADFSTVHEKISPDPVSLHPSGESALQPMNTESDIATPRKKVAEVGEMFSDHPSIAGKFDSPETLAGKMANLQPDSKRVAETLKKKPITDLEVSIGINDKFLFINHLFGGNSIRYLEVIHQINNCGSLDSARRIIDTALVPVLNWDLNNSTTGLFMEFVERRFGSHA